MWKSQKKLRKNVFPFRDICIWVGCGKLPLLRREYFWPAFKVLKKGPENFFITKRNFFELNCLHSDQ